MMQRGARGSARRRRVLGASAASLAVGAAMLALTTAAGGVGGRAESHSIVRAALPVGDVTHIVLIVLENEGYGTTWGPKSPATYLNGTLKPMGELIEHYYAIGHDSLDNYIAQVSGQAPTNDTLRDCLNSLKGALFGYVSVTPGTVAPKKYPGQVVGNGCVYPGAVRTIANQIDAKYPPSPATHLAKWRVYAEDMGNNPVRDGGVADPLGGTDCAHPALGTADNAELASATDQFTTRHVGLLFFGSIIDNVAECDANVVPLGSLSPTGKPVGHLANDLSSIATTPMFATITPNLCDDGHDATCVGLNDDGTHVGGMVGADDWLRHWMPTILDSPAYRSGTMLVAITFDESGLTGSGADAACCDEQPGPNVKAPVNGATSDKKDPGGGEVGLLLLNPKYLHTGTVDTTGYYNHYSLLRSFEDLLGLTTGGTDGYGHLGYAAARGLKPFGKDVFK